MKNAPAVYGNAPQAGQSRSPEHPAGHRGAFGVIGGTTGKPGDLHRPARGCAQRLPPGTPDRERRGPGSPHGAGAPRPPVRENTYFFNPYSRPRASLCWQDQQGTACVSFFFATYVRKQRVKIFGLWEDPDRLVARSCPAIRPGHSALPAAPGSEPYPAVSFLRHRRQTFHQEIRSSGGPAPAKQPLHASCSRYWRLLWPVGV